MKRLSPEHQFAAWLVVFIVSLVVAGLLVGRDTARADVIEHPPVTLKPAPCERVYAAPETIVLGGRRFPLHPTLIEYVRCTRARTAATVLVAPKLHGARCTLRNPCPIVRPS